MKDITSATLGTLLVQSLAVFSLLFALGVILLATRLLWARVRRHRESGARSNAPPSPSLRGRR